MAKYRDLILIVIFVYLLASIILAPWIGQISKTVILGMNPILLGVITIISLILAAIGLVRLAILVIWRK